MPDQSSKPMLIRSALKIWLLPAVLILAAQGAVLHVLSIPEKNLIIPQLNNVPTRLGEWRSVSEQALEPDVQQYLRPDSYILRAEEAEADGRAKLQEDAGKHRRMMCLEVGDDNIGRLPWSRPVIRSRHCSYGIQARIEEHCIEDGQKPERRPEVLLLR
jgi:hypothetical protein